MRMLLILLALVSSPAIAEEPTTQTAASVAARDAYKESLQAQLEASGVDEAEGKCGAAKSSYRSAESELARINVELAVPVSTAIGEVQVKYRAQLEALKRTEEAKVTKAKTDAKTAGIELAKAKARITAINAEIARIEASEKSEAEASRPTHYLDRGLGTLGRTPPDYTSLRGVSVYGSPSTKPSPLPEEFKACFPDEVAS